MAEGRNRADVEGVELEYAELIEQTKNLDISGSELNLNVTTEEVEEAAAAAAAAESLPEMEPVELEDVSVEVSDAQYEVIKYPLNMDEIISMKAGPGSGKTFTLMARIARLIGKEIVKPSEILVLSMANRSVSALKKHLEKLLGAELASQVEISTFHSFCGSVVDQYAQVIDPNLPRRRLLDQAGWRSVAEFFLQKTVVLNGHSIGATLSPARFDKLLTEIANGTTTTQEAAEANKIPVDYLEGIFQYMTSHGMMRYNDLVTLALNVMDKSLERGTDDYLLPRIATYKMVVVDEFQDMYPLLLSVIKAVVGYPTFECEPSLKKNLIIAGDQNQSIYEFLGSSPDSMEKLEAQLPDMKVTELPLNESFRCSQEILDAAIVASFNKENTGENTIKSMKPLPNITKPVVFTEIRGDEHSMVADEIVRLICCLGGLINPRDIAVLTKTNAEAVKMQHVLRTNYGIECTKISQGNVWTLSRVRLFRDILSVIEGDADSSFCLLNLLRILDTSSGASQRASKLFSRAMAMENSHEHTFFEDYLYSNLSEDKDFDSLFKNHYSSLKNIAAFLNQVQKERQILHDYYSLGSMTYIPLAVVECLQRISALDGIREFINGSDSLPHRVILVSFNESLHYCFETYLAQKEVQDRTFIEYFLQNYDQEIPPTNENLIQVLTIHSAKGLEFPIVFVLGGYSNSWQSFLRGEGEESSGQARLLYVASTRAKDLLYLSSPISQEDLDGKVKRCFATRVPDLEIDTNQAIATGIQNLKIQAASSIGNLSSALLSRLLSDLGRPLPLNDKLSRGKEYYRIFQQQRNYHFANYQQLAIKSLLQNTKALLRKLKP